MISPVALMMLMPALVGTVILAVLSNLCEPKKGVAWAIANGLKHAWPIWLICLVACVGTVLYDNVRSQKRWTIEIDGNTYSNVRMSSCNQYITESGGIIHTGKSPYVITEQK